MPYHLIVGFTKFLEWTPEPLIWDGLIYGPRWIELWHVIVGTDNEIRLIGCQVMSNRGRRDRWRVLPSAGVNVVISMAAVVLVRLKQAI